MKNTKANFFAFFKLFTLFFILYSLFFVPAAVRANSLWDEQVGMGVQDGVGSAYGETVSSRNEVQDVRVVVAKYINIFLGFMGIVFVVLIIYAGVLWISAGGNSDNVGKAKQLLISGVIGLIVIVSAYAIATFVTDRVFMATQTGGSEVSE